MPRGYQIVRCHYWVDEDRGYYNRQITFRSYTYFKKELAFKLCDKKNEEIQADDEDHFTVVHAGGGLNDVVPRTAEWQKILNDEIPF